MTNLKVEKQFLILSVSIFIFIATVLNVVLTNNIKDNFIKEKFNSLSTAIYRQAELQLPHNIFNSTNQLEINNSFQALFNELADNDVVRFEAYNTKGVKIYSDKTKFSSSSFTENKKLQAALTGVTIKGINNSYAPTNNFEKNYENLMELYLPIFFNEAQSGVIVINYDLQNIYNVIKNSQFIIISLNLVSLFVLFTGLYWIFKKTSKKLELYHQKDIENAEKILKLKNEFVFLAAHELKTPSAIIKGYLDMINKAGVKSEKRKVVYLEKIREMNERLISLINDLLEVARTESGKIKILISPEDLSKIINKEIEQHKTLAKTKKISIEYKRSKKLPKALTNPDKLSEVLSNLITNAIKYNKTGGKIIIKHELIENTIITHVIDNGIGISRDNLLHLFEKFWRVEQTQAHKQSGTGLGLFITKELIERMRGKIWVKSTLGKGTTFSFSLPIAY